LTHALITGGGGFIGLHLARQLVAAGWSVDLLDNFQRGVRDNDLELLASHDNIRLLEMDIHDAAANGSLETGYTHVFHFAAMLGVQNVLEQPYEVLVGNMNMTVAAIEIAKRQTALKRFLFASTSEVYAGTLEQFGMEIPTPEKTPLTLSDLRAPRTSYMASKLYGEAVCLHSGLPVTLIRPHNIYGPRMGLSHVIPELLKKAHEAAEGTALDVYSVDHTRTFCFVEDAVEIIYRLAITDAAIGQIVNVGTEVPEIRIGELARTIISILRKNLEIEPQPATAGSPVRRGPEMSLCTDLTGYRSQVSLEEGIRRTYDWYRENNFDA
jgi:UDP-glucose 4-epimerase